MSSGDVGAMLRARRRGLRLSLKDVARRAHLDPSTLSRYERGAVIHRSHARALDRAYEGEGAVASAVLQACRSAWTPARCDEPDVHHVHRWPAEHQGVVWLHVLPSPANVGRSHLLQLQWGPWHRLVRTGALDPTGAVFWTGKSRDRATAVDLNCDASPPCFVLFGLDEPPLPGIDIRGGWQERDVAAPGP